MWSHVLHHLPVLPRHHLYKVLTYLCMPSIVADIQPHGRRFAHAKTQGIRTVSGMFALDEEAVAQWHGISSTCHRIIAHPQHQQNQFSRATAKIRERLSTVL